ncbi:MULTISPECIES: cobalamin-dependent protein [unclassified Caballeronia]|uniref:cobalamin-dependent protein n=1 Tax=unclassified Caballeronia TaxID=2646786 RepID=UPI0020286DB6
MPSLQKTDTTYSGNSPFAKNRGTIVLGVAVSDPHVVANHLIAMYLRRQNFKVINLGACTSSEEFMQAASQADDLVAILIGSLNGHARADLADLPELRARYDVTAPIIVGGNLSVGAVKSDQVVQDLHALGVDMVLRHPREVMHVLSNMAPAVLPFQVETPEFVG